MALHEVIDQGDSFLTPINKFVTKYDVIPFAGGAKGAMGIDPRTNKHGVAWIKWPKSVYAREDLENAESITKIKARCPICDTMDYLKGTQRLTPVEPSYEVLPDETPAKQVEISVGDIVPPKYLTFGAELVKKSVCTRLGDVLGTLLMAAATDLASGYATDPGHKKACRAMSNDLIDNINLCPNDEEELKKHLRTFVEAYKEQGSLIDAVKKSMFKSASEILEDSGLEVKRTTSSTTVARIGKYGPGHLID